MRPPVHPSGTVATPSQALHGSAMATTVAAAAAPRGTLTARIAAYGAATPSSPEDDRDGARRASERPNAMHRRPRDPEGQGKPARSARIQPRGVRELLGDHRARVVVVRDVGEPRPENPEVDRELQCDDEAHEGPIEGEEAGDPPLCGHFPLEPGAVSVGGAAGLGLFAFTRVPSLPLPLRCSSTMRALRSRSPDEEK